MGKQVDKETLEIMRNIARSATPGEWLWGATPCPNKEKAMALFEDNVNATINHSEHFHEIYLEDGRRTAIIGNGPTSAANAEFIATFSPANVLLLLDMLEIYKGKNET